mmetsp:Transcript_9551/g.23779  ORF Transcript_9551/g.23779 Transcript_9551/m.23779 type:complete len:214 (-) Transcript_9551:222-863(-)
MALSEGTGISLFYSPGFAGVGAGVGAGAGAAAASASLRCCCCCSEQRAELWGSWDCCSQRHLEGAGSGARATWVWAHRASVGMACMAHAWRRGAEASRRAEPPPPCLGGKPPGLAPGLARALAALRLRPSPPQQQQPRPPSCPPRSQLRTRQRHGPPRWCLPPAHRSSRRRQKQDGDEDPHVHYSWRRPPPREAALALRPAALPLPSTPPSSP